MSIIRKSSFLVLSIVTGFGLMQAAAWSIPSPGPKKPMSPVTQEEMFANEGRSQRYKEAKQKAPPEKNPTQPGQGSGSQNNNGGTAGSESTQKQAMRTKPNDGSDKAEQTNDEGFWKDGKFAEKSAGNGGYAVAGMHDSFEKRKQEIKPIKMATNFLSKLGGGPALLPSGSAAGSLGPAPKNLGFPGRPMENVTRATADMAANAAKAIQSAAPKGKTNQAKSNGQGKQSSAASSAGEDTMECLINCFDGMSLFLINVGNEDAGSPCAANQVSKTYANAVWMVQRMYHHCFLPMGVLFLLPGALITNMKTFISFGFLHNANDEDAVSPFTGILRSIIAIFLIPMTQVIVSYMIDVGNSLQLSCQPYFSIPTIILWCEEQVQIFSPDQQGNPIKNLPNVPMAPWRGKFAGMPVKGAVLEQISGLDSALSELANECMHILSEGMTIAYAFQLVMVCYLLCLGPLAAAFFAWPAVGRDLFRKAFASWVDGVVIVSLWKFWWSIVLITMTIHCETGGMNPFDPFEVYYLVAFLCIIMFVPFNPFDFKPGEIVGHAMEKAQAVAAKVAQGGKGGGGGGGGGKGGGKAPAPGQG